MAKQPENVLQPVAAVAENEALPVGVDMSAKGDDFKEFAHFVGGGQGVDGAGGFKVGGRFGLGIVFSQQFGDAEVEQKGGLVGVAD